MTTKEFIEKLVQEAKDNNFAIAEKIQAAGKNPEAVYAIAQEVGVTDSIEAFQAEMENQYKAMTSELSEEELLAVAGGMSEAGAVAVLAGGGAALVTVLGGAAAF